MHINTYILLIIITCIQIIKCVNFKLVSCGIFDAFKIKIRSDEQNITKNKHILIILFLLYYKSLMYR